MYVFMLIGAINLSLKKVRYIYESSAVVPVQPYSQQSNAPRQKGPEAIIFFSEL
jgi:hypothetical protein